MTTPTPRPTLRQDERGIALAIAIFALVIIASLVAGVFFMARLEQRSGRNALWSTQAAEAADAGLNATLANWSGSYTTMTAGTSQTLATQTLPGNTARYTTTIRKISDQIYLVESRGERVTNGVVLSGTTVGRLVRIYLPDIAIDAALSADGPVSVAGSSRVDGRDTDPPNWPACTAKDTVSGVRTSSTLVLIGKNAEVVGDPDYVTSDPAIVPSLFSDPYTQFSALANVTAASWPVSQRPEPTASGGTCTRSSQLNWGEPWRAPQSGTVTACTDYSPVIHIAGDAQLAGAGGSVGRGQGILLVGGDLELSGNFEFVGIVIVMGEVRTTGTGNKIMGALLAANAEIGEDTYLGGNPEVVYSSCSISTVLNNTARARPIAERSWVQLY